MNFRRFFALIVLACWIPVTALIVGDVLTDEQATAIFLHEAILHAHVPSNDTQQIEAQDKASTALADHRKNQDKAGHTLFEVWVVLTLLGAGLLAEKKHHGGYSY